MGEGPHPHTRRLALCYGFVASVPGVWLLWILWDFHPSPDWLDALLGLVLYLAAFFYFLLPFRLADWFYNRLSRELDDRLD